MTPAQTDLFIAAVRWRSETREAVIGFLHALRPLAVVQRQEIELLGAITAVRVADPDHKQHNEFYMLTQPDANAPHVGQ